MTVDYRLYRAVLNPTRAQLTPGPKPYCYGCSLGLWRHRVSGVGSVTLGSWRPPRDSVFLRVPDVPPGRYLVALFDGSEGGDHYTWDFVRVTGREDEDEDGFELGLAIGAGLVLLAIVAGGLALRARRHI